MANNKSLTAEITKGILRDNPLLRLMLGTCPALAVTTSAINGIGMGAASTFVLICSNIVISLLRKIIPDKVRIPAYITVIASFVTILQFLMRAYVPDLNRALGIFIPLITVNCIILGRAEAFAGKNPVVRSALDGLGMGIGFTLSLLFMGGIREILGNGSFLGFAIPFIGGDNLLQPITIMTMPPGGFIVYGLLIAVVQFLVARIYRKASDKALIEDIIPGSLSERTDGAMVGAESAQSELARAFPKPGPAPAPDALTKDGPIRGGDDQ